IIGYPIFFLKFIFSIINNIIF
ncbi:hypothetical protein, partial [Plasmodium yoelii yoelii]